MSVLNLDLAVPIQGNVKDITFGVELRRGVGCRGIASGYTDVLVTQGIDTNSRVGFEGIACYGEGVSWYFLL